MSSFLIGTTVHPTHPTSPEWKRQQRRRRKQRMKQLKRVKKKARRKGKTTGQAERALRLKWRKEDHK